MKNKICVYTCITGNYDSLHEVEHPEKNIDYYCFTNNKNLKQSKTWKIIQIDNPENLDNCRLARKIKTIGHPIVNQYDLVVWSDADVTWKKSINDFIQKYARNTPLAIFKHHVRDNIHNEAIACVRLRKDNKETIKKLLDYYQEIQYPDNNGLCESTVFIKRPQNSEVINTMQIWFDIIKKYSKRDQLSFNYAVWRTNLKVHYIPLVVWDNTWFYVSKHTSNQEIKDCHVYFGNPDQDFSFDKYYVFPYQKTDHTYHFDTIVPNDTTEIEFNPTSVIGTSFSEITITPKPNRIKPHGDITINNQKSFYCNDHGVIRAYRQFKKGQKLSFSIIMKTPTTDIFDKIIEYQFQQNYILSSEINSLKQTITQQKEQSDNLQKTNDNLKAELDRIINSKGWKILEKTRRILRH